MRPSAVLWLTLAGLSLALAETPHDAPPPSNGITGITSHSQPQNQPQGQPTYNGQPQDNVANYVGSYAPAAASYGGYEAGYGMQNPSLYDYMIASNYPNVKSEPTPDPMFVMSSVMPTFKTLTSLFLQQVLAVLLKAVTKLGFMVFAGVGILLVGVLFTTAVCSLTPFCTITFLNGYGVTQDTVRSLLTPDKITATAEFVQHALDKYQKIQNSVR